MLIITISYYKILFLFLHLTIPIPLDHKPFSVSIKDGIRLAQLGNSFTSSLLPY